MYCDTEATSLLEERAINYLTQIYEHKNFIKVVNKLKKRQKRKEDAEFFQGSFVNRIYQNTKLKINRFTEKDLHCH